MNIVLFSDFGAGDLYVGQVKAALQRHAPSCPRLDLLHEAPDFDVAAGAHLLAALSRRISGECVFLAVVDPGVGGRRGAAVVHADGKWFVGPDNGLLAVVAARAQDVRCWRITWRPEELSASFHGRDLFAPVAAWIAQGDFPRDKLEQIPSLEIRSDGADLGGIIYLDHYGNAFTGLRAGGVPRSARLSVAGQEAAYARVFSEVGQGQVFWYENSIGLVEIAVNCGSAAQQLGLRVGQKVSVR